MNLLRLKLAGTGKLLLLLLVCAVFCRPGKAADLADLTSSIGEFLSADEAAAVSACSGIAAASLVPLSDGGLQLRVSLQRCGRQGASPRLSRLNRTASSLGNSSSHFDFVGNSKQSNETDRPQAPSKPKSGGPSISFKQSVVFAVCGAIIAAFFLVAAVMRFRNRLKKKLRKRRQMEKELQSLRKKSLECRMSEAAAASRSRNSAGDAPFFIVDYASLDNVQELDATSNLSESQDIDRSSLSQSEELTQTAAIALTTTAGTASGTADSRSRATLASPESTDSGSPEPAAPAQQPPPPFVINDQASSAAASTAAVAFRRRPSAASSTNYRPPLRKSFSYQAGGVAPQCAVRLSQQQQQRNQLLAQLHQQQQHRRLLAEAADLERHFHDRREQNRQLHQLRRASSANSGRTAPSRKRSVCAGRPALTTTTTTTTAAVGAAARRYIRSNSLAPVSSSTMAAW